MLINLGDVLARRRRTTPKKDAVIEDFSQRKLSVEQFDDSVNQCANMFVGLGLKKGDRVGIILRNSIEFLQVFLGCAKAGLVAVPINWRLVPDEIDYLVQDAGIKAMVFENKFSSTIKALSRVATPVAHWIAIDEVKLDSALNFAELRAQASQNWGEILVGNDEPAMIMYTSGTTGRPKGVIHTHASLYHATLGNVTSMDLRFDDRFLLTLPLFHIGAVTPALTNIYKGIPIIIEQEFDPMRAWQLIEREKISWTLLVPAMLLAMRDCLEAAQTDTSSLRLVISGAAPVPVELIRIYADLGIDIAQAYGLTESGALGCVLGPEDAIEKAGSTGKPQFHTDIRIVDSKGNDCQPGERGEIWIKGDHVMAGYWNLPEVTAETLVENGWLRTGDIGVRDTDGYISIVDRLKDMLISGGENISPAELEDVLLGIPEVTEAAIIGVASKRWGESPVAFVVKRDPALFEQDIVQYCSGKLAPFKRIAKVIFVDELPRNPSGKVLKNKLRELASELSLP